MPKRQIYLTGFMGTGKSTILNCLHQLCGLQKIEMDEQIVQEQGMSIPDIFAQKGEENFPQSGDRACEENLPHGQHCSFLRRRYRNAPVQRRGNEEERNHCASYRHPSDRLREGKGQPQPSPPGKKHESPVHRTADGGQKTEI